MLMWWPDAAPRPHFEKSILGSKPDNAWKPAHFGRKLIVASVRLARDFSHLQPALPGSLCKWWLSEALLAVVAAQNAVLFVHERVRLFWGSYFQFSVLFEGIGGVFFSSLFQWLFGKCLLSATATVYLLPAVMLRALLVLMILHVDLKFFFQIHWICWPTAIYLPFFGPVKRWTTLDSYLFRVFIYLFVYLHLMHIYKRTL